MSTNANLATRILPGLASEYTIVSLPHWAWVWIDNHVDAVYESDFQAFIRDTHSIVKDEKQLSEFLSLMASDLRDHQMRSIHNLANDNDASKGVAHSPHQKSTSKASLKFPTIFMIFKFIPHATDLKTVWARKNYNKYF